MAPTPLSLLIGRRLSRPSSNPKYSPALFHLFTATSARQFSTSPTPSSSSADQKPPSSLSARLSFVFDQIDAIEKERSQKDESLQRIRSWRESKKTRQPESRLGFASDSKDANSTTSDSTMGAESKPAESKPAESESRLGVKNGVELVHPWPEWIELMERLVQQNYFDHRRKDEDKMVEELGFDAVVGAALSHPSGLDFKDFRTVQTACLNFGKDRFDIFRSLSRQDIQTLVGFGCPTADKKVVFSSKLLRKHVHLDEGDVCSTCSLRNSCERAYLVTNKEDEARTIDIMRVLLAYGFDPVNGTVNKSVLKQKSVKTVVRKLLHQAVKLSSVPIDPNLPPPVIKKPPPKVKQPPPTPKRRVGRDDIEMKKGDWLCPKCDFMNFAKNTVCLQCDAKRPKRQLLPGEWECPQCNFLNYRRNTECFHCDCKRPHDEFMENKIQEKQHGPRMRLEKMASPSDFNNAWNFDFDDNESDGVDVAAFEYADSSALRENSPSDNQAQGNFGRPAYDTTRGSRVQRVHDEEFSDADSSRSGMGFDDFEDEEDDIDSYELDTSNGNSVHKAASNDFSDFEDRDTNLNAHHRTRNPSYNKQSKPMRQRVAFSGSDEDELDFDSGKELSVHPKWKSSHVADSGPGIRDTGRTGPSKRLSFGSDDETGLYSDSDDDSNGDFRSRQQGKTNKLGTNRRDFRRSGNSDIDDDSFSGSESEKDDRRSHGNRLRSENKSEFSIRGNNFKGLGNRGSTGDTKSKFNGTKTGGRRNSFKDDDDDENFDGGNRGNRGFRGGNQHDGPRRNAFKDDDDDFNGGNRGNRGFRGGNQRDGPRRNSFKDDDDDFDGGNRGNRGFRGGSQHDGPRRNSFKDDDDDFDGGNRGNRGFRGGSQRDGPRRNSFKDDDDDFNGGNRGNRGFRGGSQRDGARRNTFKDDDDFGGFSQGNRGNRGFRGGNQREGPRMSNRGSDMNKFKGPRREGFGGGNQRDGPRMSNRGSDMNKFKGPRREGFQGSKRRDSGRDKDRNFGEFKNSRRVIER